MYVFSSGLDLLHKYNVPGEISSVIMDKYLVMCNHYAKETKESGRLCLSVRKLSTPEKDAWLLKAPSSGAYIKEYMLPACGGEDGSVAVAAIKEPFIDFYTSSGECEE